MLAALGVTPYVFYILVLAVGRAAARETREPETTSLSTATPSTVPIPVPKCVTQCLTDALKAASCKDLSDTTCVCTNLVAFAGTLGFCVQRSCSSKDETAAEAIYEQTCGGVGSVPPFSPSLSVPVPPTTVLSISEVAMPPSSFSLSTKVTLVPPSSSGSQNTAAPITPSASQPEGKPAAETPSPLSPTPIPSGDDSGDSGDADVTVVVTSTSLTDDGSTPTPGANNSAVGLRRIGGMSVVVVVSSIAIGMIF
ncbi:hypothetical protein C2E23DRAFT_882181 [Lenzites betulinus]|nr:hypothetical protein C2E23DRAFT_882181 [Lenzites betulinus]